MASLLPATAALLLRRCRSCSLHLAQDAASPRNGNRERNGDRAVQSQAPARVVKIAVF
jgi:hypothetical protein